MKTQLVRSIPPRSLDFAQVMSFFGEKVHLFLSWYCGHNSLFLLGLIRNFKIEICSKNGTMTSGSSHQKFLIDNILRPEFGPSISTQAHSNDANTTTRKKEKSEKILTNETATLPSWIYCTRYSDRPSCSGEYFLTVKGLFSKFNFSIAPLINHQKVWEKCLGGFLVQRTKRHLHKKEHQSFSMYFA